MPDAPEWFSATKAAAWLSIDRKTFARMVRVGAFPRGRRIGNRKERLWNRADMDHMAYRLAEDERFEAENKPRVKTENPG